MLTAEKKNEMLEAAKPLIKWMNENVHPNCTAHVDHTEISLSEDQFIHMTQEFVKD